MLLLNLNEGKEIFFVFLLKITSSPCLLWSGLNLIFHRKTNLLICYKSLFNSFALLSTLWITKNKDASSENNFAFWIDHQLPLLIEDPKLIPELAPTLTPVHEETCPFKVSLYLLKNQIKHCVTNTLVPDFIKHF